jgi:hypothetical protein
VLALSTLSGLAQSSQAPSVPGQPAQNSKQQIRSLNKQIKSQIKQQRNLEKQIEKDEMQMLNDFPPVDPLDAQIQEILNNHPEILNDPAALAKLCQQCELEAWKLAVTYVEELNKLRKDAADWAKTLADKANFQHRHRRQVGGLGGGVVQFPLPE